MIVAAANEMLQENKDKYSLSEDDWECRINNSREWGQMGFITGVICQADVESEAGHSTLVFLHQPVEAELTNDNLLTPSEAILMEAQGHGSCN